MKRAAALLVAATCACGSGTPRQAGCPYDKGEAVANEGATHVTDEADLDYHHNPPASGPHYPVWASWGVHDDVVERGNWVHNLEHGGIVLLIGSDASDADRTIMRDAFDSIPLDEECGHRRTVLTDDPKLDSQVAAVAWDFVMEGSSFSIGDVVDFATTCRNRGREDECK